MPELKSNLAKMMEQEIQTYFNGVVQISDGYTFSQPKLVRRISLFENKIYPTGKFDSQGNYKYWFDKISTCISGEVKNIDIDTKNFKVKSDRVVDELPTIIVNLKLKDWLRDNGQSEKINSDVERGSGWGNLVWKKVKKSYEPIDLANFYVINQTAECLDESPVIERHQLSQSDLKEKKGIYKYIDKVIKDCKTNTYSDTPETQGIETTVPYYEVYERNGEVCLYDLKEENGKTPNENDRDKYVFARIIGVGIKGNAQGANVEIKYILFADAMEGKKNSDIYKEFHRSRYKGRWWREGLIELLFDVQVRLNQIGNQIAQGLEFASQTVFSSKDKLIIQNIVSDMKRGDIIRTEGLQQVQVRMDGFDQLRNDWNAMIQLANDIANSQEVVMGNALPSGTPLGAYNKLDMNANKLFGFIQEKMAIPYSQIFEEWLIPDMVDDLKADNIVNLTGDSSMLNRVREIVAEDWYLKNLLSIGPHTNDMAEVLKAQKIEELKKRPQLLMTEIKDLFDEFKKYVYVDITGEASTINEDSQSLVNIIGLEPDPTRRSFMVDEILKSKGFDVGAFPKMQPQPPQTLGQPNGIITE